MLGVAATTSLSVVGMSSRASAQGATTRLFTGAPPGSIPDVVARRYADQLSARFGRPVVVDNRSGAAGRVAVGVLRQAQSDGSSLLLAPGAVASIYPYLFRDLGYDPVADLRAVSVAAEATLGLAVGPAVPASVRDLTALRDWCRANPSGATFGSPGVGSLPHLLPAKLFAEAGIEATHVAYPGGPPAIVDLLAGRIAALALPEGLLREHHVVGRLRILATSGYGRSPFLPDVPSVAEQGFPGLVMGEWFGFFMPGGASPTVAESIAEAVRWASAEPPLRTAFAAMAMIAASGTPSAMQDRINREKPFWQAFLAASGIRAD